MPRSKVKFTQKLQFVGKLTKKYSICSEINYFYSIREVV